MRSRPQDPANDGAVCAIRPLRRSMSHPPSSMLVAGKKDVVVTHRKVGPALMVAALLAASCGGSDPQSIGGDTAQDQDTSASGTSEDEPAATSEDEPAATSEPEAAEDVADLEVRHGFSTGINSIDTRYTSAGALVTNPNESQAAYDVQILFNLIGPDGTVLDSSSETVYYIAPGETVPSAPLQIGFDLDVEPTELEVQATGEFREDDGPQGLFGGDMHILEFVSGELTASDFGTELDAQVRNTSDEVAEFASWTCVYQQGGEIVGGDTSAITDRIPPGTTVQFGTSVSLDIQADDIQCRIVVD